MSGRGLLSAAFVYIIYDRLRLAGWMAFIVINTFNELVGMSWIITSDAMHHKPLRDRMSGDLTRELEYDILILKHIPAPVLSQGHYLIFYSILMPHDLKCNVNRRKHLH